MSASFQSKLKIAATVVGGALLTGLVVIVSAPVVLLSAAITASLAYAIFPEQMQKLYNDNIGLILGAAIGAALLGPFGIIPFGFIGYQTQRIVTFTYQWMAPMLNRINWLYNMFGPSDDSSKDDPNVPNKAESSDPYQADMLLGVIFDEPPADSNGETPAGSEPREINDYMDYGLVGFFPSSDDEEDVNNDEKEKAVVEAEAEVEEDVFVSDPLTGITVSFNEKVVNARALRIIPANSDEENISPANSDEENVSPANSDEENIYFQMRELPAYNFGSW